MTTQPSDTVTLTIDGQTVVAPKGTLLVEAAKLVGLEIPIFCYHPKLKPVGACRMCLVQVEKLPRLQTACTTPVAADMIVHTATPEVVAAQTGVLELLLANHPLDCPICDKGGECPLQDNTFTYGPGTSRFTEEKRHKEKAFPLGERIILDRERCIMCYRCVRFHQEIPGDEALAAVERGAESEIATPDGEPYDSIFAGNTIELCPVGALTSRQYRFKARPWDLVRTPSVCNGCAVGCNIEVHSRTETVLRLVSRDNPAVDDGWLCDRGRFGTIPSPQTGRPTRPMLRQSDGQLTPVTWDQALLKAAELLGESGGMLASADLSNEAFWLLQRLRSAVPAALSPSTGGSWPVQGAIQHLVGCKSIVLVGLDVWNELPVLALWLRKAVQAGAKLVVLGERNGLWRNTTEWLQGEPMAFVEPLLQAVESGESSATPPAIAAAAAALRGGQPGALLAHPSLVPGDRALLERLARVLGVTADTGLLGAPLLGANARGAQEFAPDLVGGDVEQVLAARALLVIGDPPWASLETAAQHIVLATAQPIPEDPRIDVVLPMAHAYERQATLTNLEGRIQHQEGGAAPLPHARADWGIAAGLAERLGRRGPALDSLGAIRSLMADQHPAHADALRQKVLLPGVIEILIDAVRSLIIIVGLLTGMAYMTWFERRVISRMQVRIGPNRVGPQGLLQPVADALKLFFKEDVAPSMADRFLYPLAPGISLVAALAAFAVIPIGPTLSIGGRSIDLIIQDIPVALLYLIGASSLGVYGIVLGGWSSGSKYSLLGALRGGAQVVSYELVLGLALVGVVLVSGSLSVSDIVAQQARSVPFVILQPLGFVLYFTAAIAETNRAPFDLPEAEQELVAGYSTEYSGFRFAMYYIAEYVNLLTVSAIASTVFFGGFTGPFNVLPGPWWLLIKIVFFAFVFVWIRATLPRLRYDQLMRLSWGFLLPLGLLNVLATAVMVVAFSGGVAAHA